MWVLGGPGKSCGVGFSVCSAQHSRFGCQEFKIHQDSLQKSEQSGLQCGQSYKLICDPHDIPIVVHCKCHEPRN